MALPAEGKLEIQVFDTVLNGTKIVGSIVGTRQDLAEVFHLHSLGRTRVVRETRDLADINASIEEVLEGRVPGRLVFDMN